MAVTYDFHLIDAQGRRRVETLACDTPREALEAARERLETPYVELVEVKIAGVLLFSVNR